MNSRNSKTSDSDRLILNPSDKINFMRTEKYVAFSNLILTIHMENIKELYRNNKLKVSATGWNGNFK